MYKAYIDSKKDRIAGLETQARGYKELLNVLAEQKKDIDKEEPKDVIKLEDVKEKIKSARKLLDVCNETIDSFSVRNFLIGLTRAVTECYAS